MRKVWFVLAAVAVVLVITLTYRFGGPQGADFEDVEHLLEPRIVTMQPQKVILTKAAGNPNEVGGEAFGLIMKAYYGLDGVPKFGLEMKAPRARWPVGADVPMEQWVGLYAMPVPENIERLPEVDVPEGLTLELVDWEYGEVAEVLHVGPWDREDATVDVLMAFIEEKGYEVSGLHEEEYLRGPGMWFAGDPETYLTLIRYPVRPKSESSVEDSTSAGSP